MPEKCPNCSAKWCEARNRCSLQCVTPSVESPTGGDGVRWNLTASDGWATLNDTAWNTHLMQMRQSLRTMNSPEWVDAPVPTTQRRRASVRFVTDGEFRTR